VVTNQRKEPRIMRRIVIGFLIVAALVVGGGFIAGIAYQAGLSTAITTVAADAPPGSVVTPVAPVGPGYGPGYGYGYGHGWGWGGPGFGIFGILATLFVLFLVFALLRAAFWGGWRRGGPGGPGGPSAWGGPGAWGGRGWSGGGRGWGDPEHDHRGRFHETFDDWHRQAHGESSPPTTPSA
jgi:hypothetical protein